MPNKEIDEGKEEIYFDDFVEDKEYFYKTL